MHFLRTKSPLFLTVIAAFLLSVTSLWADDWKLTGSGIRVKTVAFIDVNVYSISHYMKELPPTKSKQAVIDMETGKKFVWTMKRDVDKEKIQNALKDAFGVDLATESEMVLRDKLLDAYRLPAHTSLYDAVEVYVHFLRRKFSTRLIQTIRGVGYRVSDDEPAA